MIKKWIWNYEYINGDYYNGNWENDKKYGDDIMKYSNGEKYIGH